MVSRAGIHTHLLGCREGSRHRRRINTEAKAKNVAAVWGQNFFNSLLRKLFYTRRFEAKDEFILFFQIILVQFILLFKSSQCTSILGGWWFGGISLHIYCSKASILPSIHFSIHPFLQIILELNLQHGKELNQFCPPNSSDDLSLLRCINPYSMLILHMYTAVSVGGQVDFLQIIVEILGWSQSVSLSLSLSPCLFLCLSLTVANYCPPISGRFFLHLHYTVVR